MDTPNLLDRINRMRQHGDAIRIARIVNAKRVARGEEKYSPAYIGYMLNGDRPMLPEVEEIALKYLEIQDEFTQKVMAL